MKAFHEVRNYASDFMVWHEHYDNISFVAHWHREIELIYVRSGSAEIHVTDTTLSAKQGDLVVCDSGDIHYCDTHSEDSQPGLSPVRYRYHQQSLSVQFLFNAYRAAR
jgi:mannose-6-phosphate isomerase-like protein (cupin superfamily)